MSRLHRIVVVNSLVCFALASAWAGAAVVLPTGLPTGSHYEIAFVTNGTITGSSSAIATYNTFVTTQANQDATLAGLGVTWNAIVSTGPGSGGSGVDADVNAPNNGSIPVYNTAGQLVADSVDPLYGGTLHNPIGYDQNGAASLFGDPFTGSNPNGTVASGFALGSATPVIGQSGFTNSTWIDYAFETNASGQQIYALSSPITAPEPAELSLLAVGAIGLLRRRR